MTSDSGVAKRSRRSGLKTPLGLGLQSTLPWHHRVQSADRCVYLESREAAQAPCRFGQLGQVSYRGLSSYASDHTVPLALLAIQLTGCDRWQVEVMKVPWTHIHSKKNWLSFTGKVQRDQTSSPSRRRAAPTVRSAPSVKIVPIATAVRTFETVKVVPSVPTHLGPSIVTKAVSWSIVVAVFPANI